MDFAAAAATSGLYLLICVMPPPTPKLYVPGGPAPVIGDAFTVLPLTVVCTSCADPASMPPPPKSSGAQYLLDDTTVQARPVTVLPEMELARTFAYFANTPPPAVSAVLPETVEYPRFR